MGIVAVENTACSSDVGREFISDPGEVGLILVRPRTERVSVESVYEYATVLVSELLSYCPERKVVLNKVGARLYLI